MKTNYNVIMIAALALLFTCQSWGQVTITQWDFNGTSATTVPGGATSPTPVIGVGTAELVGGTTATFASGISGGGSSDPVTTAPNNYGWNTSNYAPLGTESKQRGAQFNVSTVGYTNITFRYDHRHSNSSNNSYMFQYTSDRTAATPVWVDAQLFTFAPGVSGTTGGDRWYNLRSVDLSTATSINNNPNVAFRVVSVFDPTTGDYNSSTMTPIVYLTTGTARFDMVTISGNSILGVSQFNGSDNAFKIYPNPSNKEVVTFNQTQDITVFDALGKLIYQAKEATSIDTKSFKTGVYFIKTASGATTKLVVN